MTSFGSLKSELGSQRFRCGRRRWRRKFGIVQGNVLLHLLDLDGESATGPRERPTERDLYSVGLAVVGIVNLRGQQAEWAFGIPYKPDKQAGFGVEMELDRRLAFASSDEEIRIAAGDFLNRLNLEFFVQRFEACGQIEVSVDARGLVLCRSGHADTRRLGVDGLPAHLSVEGCDTVAIGKVHDRIAFVGRLGVNVEGDMSVAEHRESALLHAAGNFLQRFATANGC